MTTGPTAIVIETVTEDPEAVSTAIKEAIDDKVASRLFAQDPTLWGPEAEAEASIRLSWTQSAQASHSLVEEITQLRDELRSSGVTRIVLCGMGGSSLAPEVICAAAGVRLVVLDSSDPDQVRSALVELETTAVVVSSKSGGTVETDSQRRAFENAFTEAGISPADRIIVVTDPDSPLDKQASESQYRVFRADPKVGGRYSALTAFGLVPSGLAGAPILDLLEEAAATTDALSDDSETNPALILGTLLGVAASRKIDKLILADSDGYGLGDWIEQLVAESTGKVGTGILPVVVPGDGSPNFAPPSGDSVVVRTGAGSVPQGDWAAAIQAPLGSQMLLWEAATAIAGRILGINPFDQPDVESAKQAARELLDGEPAPAQPDVVDGVIELYGTQATNLTEAIDELLKELTSAGYVAIQVYLDRWEHSEFASVRDSLADRLRRPVTFGWGPRFLHSTGQFHKGGTPNGVFLQITGEPRADLDVPGREFTFGSFLASQAAGDAKVLQDQGRPLLRIHLKDVDEGLSRLREALA